MTVSDALGVQAVVLAVPAVFLLLHAYQVWVAGGRPKPWLIAGAIASSLVLASALAAVWSVVVF